MCKPLAVKVLIFSVLPFKYFLIYSEKYALDFGKF